MLPSGQQRTVPGAFGRNHRIEQIESRSPYYEHLCMFRLNAYPGSLSYWTHCSWRKLLRWSVQYSHTALSSIVHIDAFHCVGPSVLFHHVSPLCFPSLRLYCLSATYALKATSRSKISALLECTVRRFESFCKTALEQKTALGHHHRENSDFGASKSKLGGAQGATTQPAAGLMATYCLHGRTGRERMYIHYTSSRALQKNGSICVSFKFNLAGHFSLFGALF